MIRYQDKIVHFLAGYAIADMTAPGGGWISVGSATLVGLMKELYDKYIEKEPFDIADLVCTFAGGFVRVWLQMVYNG